MKESKHCEFTYQSFFYNNGKVAQCCMQDTLHSQLEWKTVDNLETWYRDLDKFFEIRRTLDSGIQHPACNSCWQYEEAALPSMRTQNLYYTKSSTKHTNIRHVDLRLSNKCNLQCKMCSPSDTDQLIKLSHELDLHNISNPFKELIPKNASHDQNILLNLILELPNLEAVRLAGGEPFIMPEVEEFLYKLLELGKTNVKIEFVTNCTSAKPKILNLLEQFNNVELMCSIDGVYDTLEYQRYPAKWSTVENNFKRMYHSKCNTRIVPCIGMLNANDLTRFFEWAEPYDKSLITYNEITEPSFLDFRLVPLENRNFLKDIGNNFVTSAWYSYIEEIQYQVRQPSDAECNKLKQYAQAWDYRCKEKFLDRYPWANFMLERAI